MKRIAALALLSLLAGCLSAPLERTYARAVEDAKTVAQNKIYAHLTPIRKDNPRLTWKQDQAGHARVLVLNWNSRTEYQENLGRSFKTQRDVWVTVYPEIKERCDGLATNAADLNLRLKELLGLPLSKTYFSFAELWVKPEDLFRPCPDPEIDDEICDLDLSEKAGKEHRQWFLKHRQDSYGPNGYPWTRLGYTYDWGSPNQKIGFSEYVIRSGSDVEVKAVYSTNKYCGLSRSPN